MLIPYTVTGVTAEHFAAAKKRMSVSLCSHGPAPDKFWVLLTEGWCEVPRDAMPLLLGVTGVDDARPVAVIAGGHLKFLGGDELSDAEMIYRAGAKAGGRCR